MKRVTWVPVDDNEAASLIGEGVHTGMRKGSDRPDSHTLWKAVQSHDDVWSDALAYCIDGLSSMGYALCKEQG